MTNWANLDERKDLLFQKEWDDKAWDVFYKKSNVHKEHRCKLNKLREMLNVKPLSPRKSLMERAKFELFKQTQEYKDRVNAAWGLRAFKRVEQQENEKVYRKLIATKKSVA
jgi:hypothetical protein